MVKIRPEATLNKARAVAPTFLTGLIAATFKKDEYREMCVTFSRAVGRVVESVQFAGTPPGGTRLAFEGTYVKGIPLDAFTGKLTKPYTSDAPMDLLAHFGHSAWGIYPKEVLDEIKALLAERGLGPFRRVWVMDWNELVLVVPPR